MNPPVAAEILAEKSSTIVPDYALATATKRRQTLLWRSVFFLVILLIAWGAYVEGMKLRQWTWQQCESLRWPADRDNAFYWGSRLNVPALLNKPVPRQTVATWSDFRDNYRATYDIERIYHTEVVDRLDYTPLRLLVAGLWARYVLWNRTAGNDLNWNDVSPLLWLNVFCTLAAAAGAFFVVHLWTRRRLNLESLEFTPKREIRPLVYALIAAALIWFNPAVIVDTHGWPQWDVWNAPFFVWAIYCASIGAWFIAGGLIVIGAMLKGQLLLGVGAFALWALVAGIRPAIRLILGVFTFAGIITSIWILPNERAWMWMATVILTATFSAIAGRRWLGDSNRSLRLDLALAIFTLAIGWPVLIAHPWRWGNLLVVSAAWLAICLPMLITWKRPLGKWMTSWIALVLCVGLWGGSFLFYGSFAWWEIGFQNPTDHFQVMSYSASSIPTIMQTHWGWQLHDILFNISLPKLGFPDGLTVQWGMRLIYGALLLLCGIAAAIQGRRRSARVLLAVIAPYILFYAVLPQMQERYLLWGAIFSALAIGFSIDMGLLCVVISFICFVDILRKMCWLNQSYAPLLYRTLGPTEPGNIPELGWVVLLVGLIYLYMAWKIDRPGSVGLAH